MKPVAAHTRECTVEGCDRPARSRKLCSAHYCRWKAGQPLDSPIAPRRTPDPEVRFWKMARWGQPSDFRPELGPCLIWTGADNGNGYGQFSVKGRNTYAHRYAWERKHGLITGDLTVDHLCRVRCCVNVDHMELTDRLDNYLRGVATRDSCPNGHEYTADNLYTKPGKPGVRLCKQCKDDTGRRGALRRTLAFQGVEEQRSKFDAAERDRLVIEVVERRLTVGQAAEQLGCAYKYMDKLVTREAKARGVLSRRHHKGPIVYQGWTQGKTRVAVQERSNGVCERCDLARATEMHHRKNRSQSGQWHPANILHLCSLCHVEITAEPEMSRHYGWALAQHRTPADIPVLRRGVWVLLADNGDIQQIPEPAGGRVA